VIRERSMPLRAIASTVLLFCIGLGRIAQSHAAPARQDVFSFLSPIQIGGHDREQLARGETIAKTLPARGRAVAVLAAGSTTATAEALLGKVRDIVGLKKSPMVPEIGRFSAEPQLRDLAALTLDPDDIRVITRCRADDCDLKLSAGEIERLQRVAKGSADQGQVDQEFRRVMLERAPGYVHRGQREIPRYADDEETDLSTAFETLVRDSPYLRDEAASLCRYLERYPDVADEGIESFLYWSKETVAPKPIISVTHVTMARTSGRDGRPQALVVSKEVFATRYTSGALAVTMLLAEPGSESRRYMVYINRTWVDALRMLWRPIIEYRVRRDAAKVFAEARERIEAGDASKGIK
jgi:hypothetical protein